MYFQLLRSILNLAQLQCQNTWSDLNAFLKKKNTSTFTPTNSGGCIGVGGQPLASGIFASRIRFQCLKLHLDNYVSSNAYSTHGTWPNSVINIIIIYKRRPKIQHWFESTFPIFLLCCCIDIDAWTLINSLEQLNTVWGTSTVIYRL